LHGDPEQQIHQSDEAENFERADLIAAIDLGSVDGGQFGEADDIGKQYFSTTSH
jgi:hypothetical protein